MPDVRVREATPEDADAIADVHAAAVRELGGSDYDDRQVLAWLANVHPERYPIDEADAGIRVVVAERGDRLAGFGWLDCDPSGRDESTAEIVAVFVRPDAVREGIGRAILERLERLARDAGLEAIVLVASKHAIDFYRRQGYEDDETVELEMTDDVSLAGLRMRKRLSPS
ncbi:GNAT family N-acetyltransferase [Natronococcus wangiae]|uniref:GNAT family N-acetyltransferase n=1 Tax=Natronococcus wangiae TaxID=3068275 RepID=UPI00273E4DA2|nr:GNAT family N-acetyltransferase [Natronococcus sp. AD5]